MPKKTVKVGLGSVRDEPAAGDVNISYKGSRIAGLTESSTAILETENTIVEADIRVDYDAPTPNFPNISGTFPRDLDGFSCSGMIQIIDGRLYNVNPKKLPLPLEGIKYIPRQPDLVSGTAHFDARLDIDNRYTVTVNGAPISYDSEEYAYIIHIPLSDYMTNINIIVTEN